MHFTTLFIWFILYSIIGWVYETIYCSIKELHWDNRGMLFGPYCPIYGVGAVADVLLCSHLGSPVAVFFCCVIGSAILEYTTSYVTERLFHAVWWDYSDLPLNLHGRICLFCSLGFGAAGLVILYGIHPFMVALTDWMPLLAQEVLSLVLMAIFAADCAWTVDSLATINQKLEETTRAIDSQISERYDNLIANTKLRWEENLDLLKKTVAAQKSAGDETAVPEKGHFLSLEQFREQRTHEEIKKTISSMSHGQKRLLRSVASFRQAHYGKTGNRIKHVLLLHRKNKDKVDGMTDSSK
ncbi:MAG: putative ABC transporter permease [Faecousia sp.]